MPSRVALGLVLLAIGTAALSVPVAAASPPNIIVVLADDMGFGDVQALNPASRIPTPSLDRLAAEGMTFADAHTPSSVCTPTRYGLLTGRYAWRGRLKSFVLDGYDEPLIEEGRPTVASFLKEHGYHTGIVGKWHLGLGFARRGDREEIDFGRGVSDGPHTRGFDFSFIIPASLDFPPYVYIRNGQITRHTVLQSAQAFPAFMRHGPIGVDLDPEKTLDDLLVEALGYLNERARHEEPFFLYVPLTAPHKPVLPARRFVGATPLGPYGDFVAQVDWTAGQILTALDSLGLADDTLFVYTSDNGSFMYRREDPGAEDHVSDPRIQAYRADHHTANGPWRGTKADIWEAGHRVPFLLRWPGVVSPESRSEATICLTDVFATLADVVGASVPEDAAEDSFSFLPLLRGEPDHFDRAPVVHHSVDGMFAIREGRWKLIAGNGSGGREEPKGSPFGRPYQLFDLDADPAEREDVLSEHPDVARRLEAALERIRTSGRSRH
jgi:arylsulfatase A-like enzyme